MDKKKFIELIKDGAIQAYKKYNILPSLTIAQAILESSWGDRAPGCMLFGIKWTPSCGYDSQLLWTTEYSGGRPYKIQAKFRKYNNFAESILDHAELLTNSRYASVRQAKDYKSACQAIQRCGYATDPAYAQKLIAIIEANSLQRYDMQMPVLKVGDKGEDVASLQRRLYAKGQHIEASGVFDKPTEQAVMNLQKSKGLVIDGIVGPKTWEALI